MAITACRGLKQRKFGGFCKWLAQVAAIACVTLAVSAPTAAASGGVAESAEPSVTAVPQHAVRLAEAPTLPI